MAYIIHDCWMKSSRMAYIIHDCWMKSSLIAYIISDYWMGYSLIAYIINDCSGTVTLRDCRTSGMSHFTRQESIIPTVGWFQVLQTLYGVSSAATSIHKYAGECIGTKLSEANERDFDEATLKAGQNVLGAQMGAFKGDSQSGMNMGKTRKVCD